MLKSAKVAKAAILMVHWEKPLPSSYEFKKYYGAVL